MSERSYHGATSRFLSPKKAFVKCFGLTALDNVQLNLMAYWTARQLPGRFVFVSLSPKKGFVKCLGLTVLDNVQLNRMAYWTAGE